MGGRRFGGAVLIAATFVAFVVGTPPASARHNLSMLRVFPALSAPGADVEVSGFSYTRPVSIHFGAIDGPVLATFAPDSNSDIKGTVTVPADARSGTHLLFATQDDGGRTTRLPARALLTVAAAGGAPLVTASTVPEPRAADVLRKDDDVGAGSLALAALGGAGVALFLVGAMLVFSGRRSPGRAGAAA